MNTADFINELRARDIRLIACGQELIVDAPPEGIPEDLQAMLRSNKTDLLAALSDRARNVGPIGSPLVEYAARRAPVIRCTLRETGDACHDLALLHRIVHLIGEYQPGANHVYIRVRRDGNTVGTLNWRALAASGLRLGLARVLREAAVDGTR